MPRARRFGGALFSWATARAIGVPISDSQCGYTAISRGACDRLDLDELWPRIRIPQRSAVAAGAARATHRRGARSRHLRRRGESPPVQAHSRDRRDRRARRSAGGRVADPHLRSERPIEDGRHVGQGVVEIEQPGQGFHAQPRSHVRVGRREDRRSVPRLSTRASRFAARARTRPGAACRPRRAPGGRPR